MKGDATMCTLALKLSEAKQLFNSMDPAPFRERELDSGAADYIVKWAIQAPRQARLRLEVEFEKALTDLTSAEDVCQAVRDHFGRQAEDAKFALGRLFHRGRMSLLIGMMFLAVAIATSEVLASALHPASAHLVRESLAIGGWVALWHPLDVFLYQWWPVAGRIRLYRRLERMSVNILAGTRPG